MALAPISTSGGNAGVLGLDFQAFLNIILTQLTYQDPLKPVDNFQFVSQLAQFTQLQQTQTLNDQIGALLSAQAATQATSLLGRTVDFASGQQLISGVVEGISFSTGQPTVTVRTPDDQVISGVSIANISNVRS